MITETDTNAIVTAVVIGLSAVLLLLIHEVADHWGQRHKDAITKGNRTRAGQLACAIHVGMYLTQTHGVLLLVLLAVGLPFHPLAFVGGVVLNGAQHYWADRRLSLEKLARATGRGNFYDMGRPKGKDGQPHPQCMGTGGYILDQSFHKGFIALVAIVTGIGAGV